MTTGLIGLALLLAFLVLALPAARWLSPLGGFAVLALLMHLVEPQNAVVTPMVFFAMGAAVPLVVAAKKPAKKQAERMAQQQAERRVQLRVTTARVVLLVVGLAEVVLIGLGAHAVNRVNGSIAASDLPALHDSLRTATWQLPVWADAYDRLADLDHVRAQRGDSTALADEVEHRRQAVEREPYFAAYWAKLAVAQAAAGDYEGAKASYRKALAVNPWAADIQVDYAKLLMSHGENAEARRQLRACAARPPRPPRRRLAAPAARSVTLGSELPTTNHGVTPRNRRPCSSASGGLREVVSGGGGRRHEGRVVPRHGKPHQKAAQADAQEEAQEDAEAHPLAAAGR